MSPTRPNGVASVRPRAKRSRPSCGRRSSQSAPALIRARSTRSCRSASASCRACCASGASSGRINRDRSWVSVAAMTSQSPQRLSSKDVPLDRSSAPPISPAKASTSAPMDSRARSIFCARTISSNQSIGPSNPSTDNTGATSLKTAREESSHARTAGSSVMIGSVGKGSMRERRWGARRNAAWASVPCSGQALARASSRPTRTTR